MRNYNRVISLNKASKVTGVNVVTMRKDIEKGRIDAFYYRGRYHIEVGELIRYADYIHHSNRAVLICPMPVILHRIDYMIFNIFE